MIWGHARIGVQAGSGHPAPPPNERGKVGTGPAPRAYPAKFASLFRAPFDSRKGRLARDHFEDGGVEAEDVDFALGVGTEGC